MTERLDVQFVSGGTTCRSWLYRPNAAEPRPVIVMANGFGGVRGMVEQFAERFCAAGYACLLFDYRHFGASDGHPRQLFDIRAQLADLAAAIAVARFRDDVDRRRIILWGTSFGGGHVITTAARDNAVSAVIAQCPFTDGRAATKSLHPLSAVKTMPSAIADAIAGHFNRQPVYLSIGGPPKSKAVLAVAGFDTITQAVVPEGAPWRNEVTARVLLAAPFYRPGREAANIQAPALFCVCQKDAVTPAKDSLAHLQRAPRGEIKVYDEGHFDIYFGEAFETVVADQIAFLRRHVP